MARVSGQLSPGLCMATVVLLALVTAPGAASTVYRCQSAEGLVFSDRPCGSNAESITLRDNRVGGSLADNLPEFSRTPPEPPAEPEAREPESPCRYINSTNLRTYLARNQVVPGMTREHVERAFGRTSEVYTSPQEVWVYQTRYYGALYELTWVYFRDGCVERVDYRRP